MPRRPATLACHAIGAFLLCVLWFSVNAVPVAAQFSDYFVPDEAVHGQQINVVVTWEGGELLNGVDVDLPPESVLDDVHVLRFGREPIETRIRRRDSGFRAAFDNGRRTPLEIILTIRMPDSGFDAPWRVTPLRRDPEEENLHSSGTDISGQVTLLPVRDESADQALSFGGGSGTVLLRPDRVPRLSYHQPFEVSFWMRTTGLNQVPLSFWNGREGEAYPLEFEIGPTGRLFVYRSDGDTHQSISSRRPVADGAWHEIQVIFDGNRTALRVDGAETDAFSGLQAFRRADAHVLALGGRIPDDDQNQANLFTGELDDLRVTAGPGGGNGVISTLKLDFDGDLDENILARGSSSPLMVASSRHRMTPPGSLVATFQNSGLILGWEGSGDAGGFFEVERSIDGRHFEVVAAMEVGHSDDTRFEHVERDVRDGVQYFRIAHVLPDGSRLTSRAVKVGLAESPRESIELIGNFPNPFNSTTTIAFRMDEARNVELSIWDLSGQQLAVLVDEIVAEGRHEVQFDAGNLPSGTYFVRLQTPIRSVSHKMILAR